MSNEFFDFEEEKLPEEEIVIKPLNIFSYLNDITMGKKGNIHIDQDPQLKGFSSFKILRYLSLEPGYCGLVNILNTYQGSMSKEEMYKTLIILIPRARKFLQYPKLSKDGIDEETLKLIKTYFKCSMEEAKVWISLKLLSVYDIEKIKESFGGKVGKKKEIKKKKADIEDDI